MLSLIKPEQEITAAEWSNGLTKAQRTVFLDPARFRVVVAGRRFGKTVLGINETIYEAQTGLNLECWCIEPTYRMAEMLVWEPLKRAIPYSMIAKKDESDLSITLRGYGSTIRVRGAENYDSLRGPGLDWCWPDEFADIEKDAWEQVLRPALADKKGRALFTGTPKGYNWAYDLWLAAATKQGWAQFQFTTEQGGNVDPEELAAAKSDMDPRIYRQEFLASFESLHGRVYNNYVHTQYPLGNLDGTIEDRGGELLIGIDFNVNPMSAIIAQRAGDECEVLDAVPLMSSNTEELAQYLRDHYKQRILISCPDPSGRSRKTSAPVGQTDFTILLRHQIAVRADPSAPPVVDRINAVQTLLLAADGKRRLRIHPRASYLIKTLNGLTYKEGTSLVNKKTGLDHAGDALGYLVWQEFNRLQSRAWSTTRVPV